MSTGVVLLAAGGSRRFGPGSPKQLKRLAGLPLFLKSLKVFSQLPSVHEILLVVTPKQEKKYKTWLRPKTFYQKVKIVSGGRFRGESVKKGILAASSKSKVILIHDTARPLVSKIVIQRVEKAASRYGVAVAAWPVSDTLKKINSKGNVQRTVPRKDLWLAQTPQGFRTAIAKKVLLHPRKSATDDVEMAERKGYAVKVVTGDPKNFKITYPYHYRLCQVMVKNRI